MPTGDPCGCKAALRLAYIAAVVAYIEMLKKCLGLNWQYDARADAAFADLLADIASWDLSTKNRADFVAWAADALDAAEALLGYLKDLYPTLQECLDAALAAFVALLNAAILAFDECVAGCTET